MREIERKFLVDGRGWGPGGDGEFQRQGYLAITERGTVRVRVAGNRAVLGIKSAQRGLVREEYEYEIPLADGEAVTLFVTRRPGADVDPEQVLAFMRAELPTHMVPRSVHLLDALPLTANGKTAKAALRELASSPAQAEAGVV